MNMNMQYIKHGVLHGVCKKHCTFTQTNQEQPSGRRINEWKKERKKRMERMEHLRWSIVYVTLRYVSLPPSLLPCLD